MSHEVIKGQCERHTTSSTDPSQLNPPSGTYAPSFFFFLPYKFPFLIFDPDGICLDFCFFWGILWITLIDKLSCYNRTSWLALRCPCTGGNNLCRALPMAVTHSQNCLRGMGMKNRPCRRLVDFFFLYYYS